MIRIAIASLLITAASSAIAAQHGPLVCNSGPAAPAPGGIIITGQWGTGNTGRIAYVVTHGKPGTERAQDAIAAWMDASCVAYKGATSGDFVATGEGWVWKLEIK